MNYTTYKIKSKIKIITTMITDTFFDIIFFIPRYFYKNSPKFRAYIENSQISHTQNHDLKNYLVIYLENWINMIKFLFW